MVQEASALVRFPPDESSYGSDIGDNCCVLRLHFSYLNCTGMKQKSFATIHSSRNFLVKGMKRRLKQPTGLLITYLRRSKWNTRS